MSTRHPVAWQTPQPLWARFGTAAPDQARPALLRFAGDDFMDQLLATLARDPARVDALVARPETWRAEQAAPAALVQQTPLPRMAAAAARATAAKGGRSAVSATVPTASVREGAIERTRPLKLYHPAHHRFYLAGASLVCGVPGLPERAVQPGPAEQVGFVIRRLLPDPASSTDPAALREFAYVKDAAGARWRRVAVEPADEGTAAAGEERLPVFPLPFQDDAGRPRTLWGGLVPVGRREEYVAAGVDRTVAPGFAAGQLADVRGAAAPAPRPSKQARLARFQMEVAEPWKNLIRGSYRFAASTGEPSPFDDSSEPDGAAKQRDRVWQHDLAQQDVSWLVLLDLSDWLAAYLPAVSAAIDAESPAGLDGNPLALWSWLGTAAMPAALVTALRQHDGDADILPPAASLRDALRRIRADGAREQLESAEVHYAADTLGGAWPGFHFVLAGVDTTVAAAGPFAALASLLDPQAADAVEAGPVSTSPAEQAAAMVDKLTALAGRALEARVESDAPPLPFAQQLRDALAASVGDAGWFVVRFVYARTDCGPLHPPVLSAPSQRFQLASFYDADAPARPIRITLPLDTSPAGLRRFNRNTAFVVSDMLCGQIQRAKGMGLIDLIRAVLPWPLHKDLDTGGGGSCTNGGGINIGMICSLSIPIITICALIVLIIMVSLLDLIFHWLPFFIFCFPLPRFGAKKAAS